MVAVRLSLVVLGVLIIVGLMAVLGGRSRLEAHAASESLMYAKGMRLASINTIPWETSDCPDMLSAQANGKTPVCSHDSIADSPDAPAARPPIHSHSQFDPSPLALAPGYLR